MKKSLRSIKARDPEANFMDKETHRKETRPKGVGMHAEYVPRISPKAPGRSLGIGGRGGQDQTHQAGTGTVAGSAKGRIFGNVSHHIGMYGAQTRESVKEIEADIDSADSFERIRNILEANEATIAKRHPSFEERTNKNRVPNAVLAAQLAKCNNESQLQRILARYGINA